MTENSDAFYMQRAIELARTPLAAPHPNPRVGCVIVNRGEVIAEGFHQAAGGPHAEVAAFNAAHREVAGSTMYITLEPCATHGRTPPCSQKIVSAAISRVVVASPDPNPVNCGLGIKQLRDLGIPTDVGVLADEAQELNRGFFCRHQQGRPWVIVKVAATLDGRIATAKGESQWITGESARKDVHNLRAQADALLTGVGTVRADNPRLNCRAAGVTRQPLRVIADSQLRTPEDAKLFDQPGEILFAVNQKVAPTTRRKFEQRASVVSFDTDNDRIDCRLLLAHLAEQQINEVLVEAGPTLVGALMEAGLVDEMVIYLAPTLLGDAATGIARMPSIENLTDQLRGEFQSIDRVGEDLRIRFRPQHAATD